MSEEIWREFNGYKVSNLGRIQGKDGRILKPQKSMKGYLLVSICINGTQKTYPVHRLVALTFLDNPENKPQVNHKNGVKDNNRVENLEWCTKSENMRHAYNTGLKVVTKNNHFKTNNPSKGKFGAAHFNSKPILQFSKDNILLREWGSIIDIQRELGISNGNISQCCNGKQKTAYGFIWKYSATT